MKLHKFKTDRTAIIFCVLIVFLIKDVSSNDCKLFLTENIPEGLMFPPNSTHTPTKDVWLDLIDKAKVSIEIASSFWTLRYNEAYNSSLEGEEVFQALLDAGSRRNIDLRIVHNIRIKQFLDTDTLDLINKHAAQVRTLNFIKLLGSGFLHTKFWITDRKHFYIGSANMDWRSITHVKEMGIAGYDCPSLALDLAKIFDLYWSLGTPDAVVPKILPKELSSDINLQHPFNIVNGENKYDTFIASSPPQLSPPGRTNDDEAIVSILDSAKEFVYIAVMYYEPTTKYRRSLKFFPEIDDTIRKVAIENKVKVRMLISLWFHSRPSEDYFLRSLEEISGSHPGVDLEVKRFVVPATPEQKQIPFARVNHNKYMVTDNSAYIGNSNWVADTYIDTAGVSFVLQDHGSSLNTTQNIRRQLLEVFERDWNSPYAVPLKKE